MLKIMWKLDPVFWEENHLYIQNKYTNAIHAIKQSSESKIF